MNDFLQGDILSIKIADVVLVGPFTYEAVLFELRKVSNKNAVYLIESINGCLKYAGSTSDLRRRLGEHIYEFRHNIHPKLEFQREFNRDKKLLFYFKLCKTLEEAVSLEQKIITELYGTSGFLNTSIDAEKPWIRKEEYVYSLSGKAKTIDTKILMSKVAKEQYANGRLGNMTGKHHSDETKEKLRIARVGKKLSNETKYKIGLHSQLGNHNLAKPCYVLGKEYDCVKSASLDTDIKYNLLYWRICNNSPKYAEYYFV